MPKSNFNQFLDECEDARTAEKASVSKISFEMKPPCNDECESKTNHNHNDNSHVKTLNTFSSNSNTHCSSGSSSNIFLSKSSNSGRGRIVDRFSTNVQTNIQTNIFKKTDDNNCFNPIHTTTTTSTSMPTVEINNETFPSLTPVTVASATTSSSGPKKFKNFRDAICATASAPVTAPAATPSPTKQKQTRALPNSAFLPPMIVKRDSEIYAKKMLAKTKNLAAFYGDEDDDDDDDGDDIRDFGCSRNNKPTFINNYGNGNDSD